MRLEELEEEDWRGVELAGDLCTEPMPVDEGDGGMEGWREVEAGETKERVKVGRKGAVGGSREGGARRIGAELAKSPRRLVFLALPPSSNSLHLAQSSVQPSVYLHLLRQPPPEHPPFSRTTLCSASTTGDELETNPKRPTKD